MAHSFDHFPGNDFDRNHYRDSFPGDNDHGFFDGSGPYDDRRGFLEPFGPMGHRNIVPIDTFIFEHDVRLYWVAFFALWVWWGLFWLIRHIFGDGRSNNEAYRDDSAADGNANVPWVRRSGVARTHNGLSRASTVLGELVLMLLSVLLLNTLLRGGTRSVMILSWVFFALAIFWSIIEAAKESHVARFIFALLFYGIALAIAGISFMHAARDTRYF